MRLPGGVNDVCGQTGQDAVYAVSIAGRKGLMGLEYGIYVVGVIEHPHVDQDSECVHPGGADGRPRPVHQDCAVASNENVVRPDIGVHQRSAGQILQSQPRQLLQCVQILEDPGIAVLGRIRSDPAPSSKGINESVLKPGQMFKLGGNGC